MIKPYDAVALLDDITAENLYRGQVGTVIEEWEPGVYEVEFSDQKTGKTYGLLALKSEQMMKLYFEPINRLSTD